MASAVIVDAVRTPIGRFGGGLSEFSAGDLATHVVKALAERNNVPANEVDEVIFGHVIQGGSGVNVARQAAVRADLSVSTCGATVNVACASGMRAIELVVQRVALGEGSMFIAGGVESMSNVPFYVREMRWGHKLGSVTMADGVMDEGLLCPVSGKGMGMIAEEIAARTGITREEMDAWALRSHHRALAALRSGRFSDEIVPVPRAQDEPCSVDEHPRETSREALAALRPAFKKEGRVTAGNAAGINDGAAALLIVEEQRAQTLGWQPRATIAASATAATEPEALDLAPVLAVRKLAAIMQVEIDEFELIELNEAFAVQAVAAIRELGLDEDKVNVNGSGVALGHPIGATGARIVTTLLYEMEKRDLRLGVAALCAAGGMGMAMAVTREK